MVGNWGASFWQCRSLNATLVFEEHIGNLALCCRLGWSAPTQTSTSSSRWREALKSRKTRAESTWFTAGRLSCRPPPTSLQTTNHKVGQWLLRGQVAVQRELLVLLLFLCMRWHYFLPYQWSGCNVTLCLGLILRVEWGVIFERSIVIHSLLYKY